MLIYCIDDEQSIRDLIVYTLNQTGYEALGFADGKSLLQAIDHTLPDLIILDIMLVGMDGLEILKQLRLDNRTKAIPVMLISAKGTEFDKVYGLDLGADDYLAKPFGMMELVSRIKAILRRVKPTNESLLTFEEITLNQEKHQVFVGTEQVTLTAKEFRVLELLMQARGKVITREVLLEKVWGYDFIGETRTVDVHIRSLRKKLALSGSEKYIKTLHGIGYVLEKS